MSRYVAQVLIASGSDWMGDTAGRGWSGDSSRAINSWLK